MAIHFQENDPSLPLHSKTQSLTSLSFLNPIPILYYTPTKTKTKTMILQPSIFLLTLFTFSFSISQQSQTTIYQILKSNGLPMGLFPKGVTNFSIDDSGRFQVFLDQACNAKFEDELHYDRNVSGSLSFGRIDELTGILTKDLFLWFLVKEIWVDTPSSGLIHFDVGVVSKQFSLASFETPRDCLTSSVPKILSRKLGHEESEHQELLRTVL